MHGDFTPQNLLRFPDGRLVLIDWEDSGWGPPDSDLVLYRATDAAVKGGVAEIDPNSEAAVYWCSKMAHAANSRREERLRLAVIRQLARMERNRPDGSVAYPRWRTVRGRRLRSG